MSEQVIIQKKHPGCLIQLLWFLFVGWWVGQIWIAVAWLLMLTILGIPLSVKMLNRLPKVFALREPDEEISILVSEGMTVVSTTSQSLQHAR